MVRDRLHNVVLGEVVVVEVRAENKHVPIRGGQCREQSLQAGVSAVECHGFAGCLPKTTLRGLPDR